MFSNIRTWMLMCGVGIPGAIVLGLLAAFQPLIALALVAVVVVAVLTNTPKAILFGLLLTVVLGQFGRIPPGEPNGAILLIDVLAVLLFATWALWTVASKRAVIKSRYHLAFLGFLGIGLTFLVLNPFGLSASELAVNGLYWVRLLCYGSLIWIVPDLFKNGTEAKTLVTWLLGVGTAVVILGFLQLYLLPDIRIFTAFGWDPHVGRMVSGFLDPNYLGGFFAILLCLLLVFFKSGKAAVWMSLAIILTLVGSVLTFSRSGYLAVGLVVLIFGIRYSWKLMVVAIICITPLAMAIPRVQERVLGGFSVDATAQLRIQSWTNALEISEHYFPEGVGYNNYQSAQEAVGTIEPGSQSRATAGTDSSLLNVLVTTGLLGVTSFLLFWALIVWKCRRLLKTAPESVQGKMALALLILILPLSVHALFVNAWFYPFIMVYLCVMTGVLFIPLKASEAGKSSR